MIKKSDQPNTTPIKDIETILLGLATYGTESDNLVRAEQAIQTYIDNKIVQELETALSAPLKGTVWVGVPEKDNLKTYLQERIKELKSNQSKGNDNE